MESIPLSFAITDRQIDQLVYQHQERHLRLAGLTEKEIRNLILLVIHIIDQQARQVFRIFVN